jgi:hypothetical protein
MYVMRVFEMNKEVGMKGREEECEHETWAENHCRTNSFPFARLIVARAALKRQNSIIKVRG